MICNKGGYFKRNGYSLYQRKRLFYGICIWVRVIIGLIIYALMLVDNKELSLSVASFVMIFSIASMIHGLSCLYAGDKVWWSRKLEVLVALILISLSAFIIHEGSAGAFDVVAAERRNHALMLSLPIWIHVILGVLLSFYAYSR